MRVAYFSAGDRNFASSRLRVWKIGDALERMGHTVAYNPDDPLNYDVCVVQKRSDCEGVMRDCRESGIRVVFDCDDYMAMDTTYADVVTVDTKSKLELYPTATVIPDALDVEPDSPRKTWHAHSLSSAVWIGNAENCYHVRNAAFACREHGIDLWMITDLSKVDVTQYGAKGVQWQAGTVDHALVAFDLFLAPFLFDSGQWSREWVASKSANRLQKAWGLGLPCAATPIPSYVEAGLKYAATTLPEWIGVLEALKGLGARVVDATRGSMRAQAYCADVVAETWLRVFEGNTV